MFDTKNVIIRINGKLKIIVILLYVLLLFLSFTLFMAGATSEIDFTIPLYAGYLFLGILILPFITHLVKFMLITNKIRKFPIDEIINDREVLIFTEYYKSFNSIHIIQLIAYLFGILIFILMLKNI